MSSKDQRTRLQDVVTNIDAISVYIGAADFAGFAADRRTVDATERCLERIAEAIVKIGAEPFGAIDPGLPFERVKGLGNLLRHAYDRVEERLIYNLVRMELPKLRAACLKALEGDLG
jgi:uncharacterized protein with HEPN domain